MESVPPTPGAHAVQQALGTPAGVGGPRTSRPRGPHGSRSAGRAGPPCSAGPVPALRTGELPCNLLEPHPPCWMRLQQVTNHSTGEGRSLHRTSNSAAPEPTPSGPPGGGPRVEGTPLHGQKQTEARRLCRSSVHPSVHLSPILQLPPVHLPTYPACFIYQYVNSDYL